MESFLDGKAGYLLRDNTGFRKKGRELHGLMVNRLILSWHECQFWFVVKMSL